MESKMNIKPFKQRVQEGWDTFLKREIELRKLIDEKQEGNLIVETCNQILKSAFQEVYFEMGYNGEKYELILTPDGSLTKLFPLVYFQGRVPKEVLKHWNILVGRQPCDMNSYALQMLGQDLTAKEVQVWVQWQENGDMELSMYCEKLVPLLKKEENNAYWLMNILLDQVIGEIAAMRYVKALKLLEMPLEEEHLTLDQLWDALQKKSGKQKVELLDASGYCERCTAYEMQPNEDENGTLREDVYFGITSCVPLLNEYLRGEEKILNSYEKDGIQAGFFYYPLYGFEGEDRGAKILDFREHLEEEVRKLAGEDAVLFVGGASGIYCGYLDFIAWDLGAVLNAAADIFEKTDLPWAGYHSFCRGEKGIVLKDETPLS